MRRILITGGTGFVGPHLIRFLRSSGVKIIVVSSGDPLVREAGTDYCKADIRNADDVAAVIRTAQPEYIYHLAGVSSITAAWNDPRRTFEVNVVGTYNVFDAAMRLPSPPRILNVSTAQVYSPSDSVLPETSAIGPDNPYAATKAMAELLTVQYRTCGSGGVITARAFNHTGPGQLPSFALPSFAKQLAEMEAGLKPPVLKVGNINVSRDFTDVRDVVAAYHAILDKGLAGEIYNVCSGRDVLLADVVAELHKYCKTEVEVEIDPARCRAEDAVRIVGDPAKTTKTTGWKPRISLEDTIKDLLAYWRAQVKSRKPGGNIVGESSA